MCKVWAGRAYLVRGRDAAGQESEPVYKFFECKSEMKVLRKLTLSCRDIPDRVPRPSNPNGFQHSRVTQLSAAKLTVKHLRLCLLQLELQNVSYQWLFELIWLDASNEEGIAFS